MVEHRDTYSRQLTDFHSGTRQLDATLIRLAKSMDIGNHGSSIHGCQRDGQTACWNELTEPKDGCCNANGFPVGGPGV
jgi:hypothetical protein